MTFLLPLQRMAECGQVVETAKNESEGLLSRDYPDLPDIMDKPLTAFATCLRI